MRWAMQLARCSTCQRLSVACVLASLDNRRLIGFGYNGNARGMTNRCTGDPVKLGGCGCTHAEANALVNMDRREPFVAYATHQPCEACAKMLVNTGLVQAVFYGQPYRLAAGAELLEEAGVPCRQWNPAEEAHDPPQQD